MKHVLKEIVKSIAGPLGRRVGTAFAAYLLARGVPQDLADQMLMALGVVGGVTLDVAMSMWRDKKVAVR